MFFWTGVGFTAGTPQGMTVAGEPWSVVTPPTKASLQNGASYFITAYDEYAVQAFDASAVDYILKPSSRERVAAAVTRARERRRVFHAQRHERSALHAPNRGLQIHLPDARARFH
jgi:DNA-binding LytR/AlgR family response regulator